MKKLSRVLGVTLSLALLLQCVLFSGIPSKAETSSSVRNPGFENGTDTDVYDWDFTRTGKLTILRRIQYTAVHARLR